jgi:hypothetical protein
MSSYGIAVVRHTGHNTFCKLSFKAEYHLSLGTVFTGYIPVVNNSTAGSGCEYLEWLDKHAPIKVVGHVSRVTVRSVIENLPPKSTLASAPNEYGFIDDAGEHFGDVSYSASAAKTVHRAEYSGKAVTVRIKISKGGLRHLGFVR